MKRALHPLKRTLHPLKRALHPVERALFPLKKDKGLLTHVSVDTRLFPVVVGLFSVDIWLFSVEVGLFAVDIYPSSAMGWLRVVASLKLYVCFAEYHLFCRSLLPKRPIILKRLLIVATP